MRQIGVGVVGCGVISDIYLKNLTENFSDTVKVAALCDLDIERARAAAEKYAVPAVTDRFDELLKNQQVEIVLNLTTPGAHHSLNMQALEAGKHVYVEKPLAIRREDGQKQVALAKEKGLYIGGAPDTFLGAGIQTCRRLIDSGIIGEPVAATAFMTCHGHESWHPAPEFYYKEGAGPMMDMGPYYLTALVALMGPVKSVSGAARTTFPTRTITSQPLSGKVVEVEVPTHVTGILHFENDAIGNILTSFDVWAANLPCIEIYGSLGSLSVPDPNTFGGPVRLRKAGDKAWQDVPLDLPYAQNSRGLGVYDMAKAILEKRDARVGGALTLHVLDVMQSIVESAEAEKMLKISSICQSPATL